MAASRQPVATAIVGMGNWAGALCEVLEKTVAVDNPTCAFLAASSRDPGKYPELATRLAGKGVKICKSFEELLALPIDAIWLPVSIDQHRPMTEQALQAGKAVLCEKPVAGCVDDVDAMIAARDAAGKPVGIAYQDIWDPTTVLAKRALLDGTLGQVRDATVYACWPRNEHYFSRNDWAGKLRMRGAWVLDSPANNAMAHYINITLFLLGPAMPVAAQPVRVEAELYRVNPIENFDTCSLRLTLDNGARFLVHYTHCAEQTVMPEVVIEGSKGVLRRSNEKIVIEAGGKQQVITREGDPRIAMANRFARLVRGEDDPTCAVATLEASRAQTVAINGAAEAAPVRNVPMDQVKVGEFYGGKLLAIRGIEQAFAQCTARKQMLHESAQLPWTTPAGSKDTRNYRHFAGPKTA